MPRHGSAVNRHHPREKTMRLYLLAAAIAFAVPAVAAPAWAQEKPNPPAKLFGSAAEVQSLLAKLRAAHKPGSADEIIVSVGPYPVELEYRTSSTPPGLHKAKAEFLYVEAGSCTLVTGGTLVNAKDKGANISGTAIKGGHSQKLNKGDYALIPPNTPHWYNDVRGEFAIVTTHMPMAAQ
jgi:mannose-6-phosphate isomerase-like protein (cupin superfamily)